MPSDLNEQPLHVLTFAGVYLPGFKGGGPIKTIKNLFEQAGKDISFKLVTSDRDLGDAAPYTSVACGKWNEVGNSTVFYAQPGKKGYRQIAGILREKNYDVVYLNSFFSPRFSLYPLLLSKLLRLRVVLSPRGEFSEGALGLKSLKKKAFITVYKLLRLHRGTVFQVSSDYEAEDVRRALGPKVDTRVAENIGAQEFAEHLEPRTFGPLRSVFISRISPKKNLLAALKMLKNVHQPLSYDIFGPIEDLEYWRECEKVISVLPPHVQVQHKGTLNPDEVVNALENYDVFFFPTKGENYGHVIAEALCAGLPIVISDTTPWRNLQSLGIGWDLPLNNPEAFSEALNELASMPEEDHLRMRQTVLTWAKNKFSQRDAVEANIALFKYAYEKK
jgi:glycosyltransferase involved in cell wall biosynthesis